MSFPRRKAAFDAWSKAMVAGATVDKPDYGKTSMTVKSKRRRRRRKRRKNDAKTEKP